MKLKNKILYLSPIVSLKNYMVLEVVISRGGGCE